MMLDPDQRTNFLDLLRPPSGYRLAEAVGTTYSMDFIGLTSVLLAFVDAEAENESEKLNHVEVLRAITRLARRVRVFVSRGRITDQDAARHGKLSGLFDRIVREVNFKDGCFHPKVWVARYEPKATAYALGQKPLVRIVCASRNLTQGSRWEIFVSFEGRENGDRTGNGFTRDISNFLGQLKASAGDGEDILCRIQAALLRIQIDLPRQMEGGCHFNWQWNIGKPLWNSFTKQGTRALIVSPFVRANFLSRVVSGFNRIDLVSTQNELDALSDEFYKTLAAKAKVFVVRPAETENGSAAMQLHAKLFICETETECKVLLGSANASDSAWKSRNCEAVVSFVPGMSIDQFYQSFIISPKTTGSEKNALRGWVERYERRPVTVDETALAEKALDKLQKMLIGLNFHASYDLEKMLLRITCPEMSSQLELVETVAHHRLRLCPLSRYERAGDLVSADNLLTGGVEFSGIRVLDLSDFLVVEIEHPSKVARQFIVMASTDYAGLRDARDAAILNEYLTAESFRLFMRAILFDGVNQSPPKGSGATRQKKGEETGWTLLGEITLEEVLQSCTEDPSRIGEINQLLQVFRETKAADGEFILFQEFWNVFQTAHAETERDLHG